MKWLDEVRGTDSIREVARRVGMNQGTLNRQVNLDQLSFDTVRDVSRAYGRPVLSDLIALGHLAPHDVGVDSLEAALRSATDEHLVMEIARRLEISPSSSIYDAPLTTAVTSSSNVVRGDFGVGGSVEDLPSVARPSDPDNGEDQ